MPTPVTALVVAAPGRLRDAWRALLVAVPGIDEVHLADDAAAALRVVERQHAGLVLVDGDLADGGAPSVVTKVKFLQPGARCIVLVCCAGQEWQPGEAQPDAVLIKGFAAARLFETVSRVLSAG